MRGMRREGGREVRWNERDEEGGREVRWNERDEEGGGGEMRWEGEKEKEVRWNGREKEIYVRMKELK